MGPGRGSFTWGNAQKMSNLHGGSCFGVLFFWALLGVVLVSAKKELNTRKTRVFELPGARKKRENAPQNPRKIRGFGWETSVFARFGYVFEARSTAKPSVVRYFGVKNI